MATLVICGNKNIINRILIINMLKIVNHTIVTGANHVNYNF